MCIRDRSEGAIDPGTVITDTGIFERLGLKLKCWVYPRNHGSITVSQAIRDSCNYFFAETAYRLSLSGDTYQEEKGLNAIAKYATEFGLADKTNIEIPEGTPKIADEFPIDASIGQSNHSYTCLLYTSRAIMQDQKSMKKVFWILRAAVIRWWKK